MISPAFRGWYGLKPHDVTPAVTLRNHFTSLSGLVWIETSAFNATLNVMVNFTSLSGLVWIETNHTTCIAYANCISPAFRGWYGLKQGVQ